MSNNKGYSSKPLPFTRQMVLASVSANKKNAIHSLSQINVTVPRKLMGEYEAKTGEKLSFTR